MNLFRRRPAVTAPAPITTFAQLNEMYTGGGSIRVEVMKQRFMEFFTSDHPHETRTPEEGRQLTSMAAHLVRSPDLDYLMAKNLERLYLEALHGRVTAAWSTSPYQTALRRLPLVANGFNIGTPVHPEWTVIENALVFLQECDTIPADDAYQLAERLASNRSPFVRREMGDLVGRLNVEELERFRRNLLRRPFVEGAVNSHHRYQLALKIGQELQSRSLHTDRSAA